LLQQDENKSIVAKCPDGDGGGGGDGGGDGDGRFFEIYLYLTYFMSELESQIPKLSSVEHRWVLGNPFFPRKMNE